MSRRAVIMLVVMGALAAGAVWLRLVVGDQTLHLPESDAVWQLRITRVLAGLIVGSSLAVAGLMLQSLLRNPLASPDLLGLASGAGLAVMVTTYVAYKSGVGSWVVGAAAGVGGGAGTGAGNAAAAVVGSLLALAVVYLLSQRRGLIEPVSLILVGVIISIVCGAGAMLVAHLLPDGGMSAMRWMMGALSDDVSAGRLWLLGAVTVVGIGIGLWYGRAMDAAAMGEDEARSVGVPLGRLRLVLFLASGVLTAGSVVLAGPIGFVGLVCPHVARLMAGPGHRVLVAGSALAGAAMIVGADALIKLIDLGAGRMPLGVVTALVGGPVFLVLLRRALR